MDYFLAGEDQQQTNQPNNLAGDNPLTCNLKVKLNSETMDIFWLAGRAQQAQQSTHLAEGLRCLLEVWNPCNLTTGLIV